MGTFDIQYKPRNSLKGEVSADFVAEFTLVPRAPIGIYQVIVKQ